MDCSYFLCDDVAHTKKTLQDNNRPFHDFHFSKRPSMNINNPGLKASIYEEMTK